MSIYRKLANQFIDEIETGKRPEGGRMPSLRQLAKQQAISMSTVVSCYQELESQGWIHSRPQAGYFVSPHKPVHSTPEWAQFESKVSKVRQTSSTHNSINGPLGVSSTTNDAQSTVELERSFRRSIKRMGDRLNHYPDTQGEPMLRQALSTHFAKLDVHFSPEEMVITAGCMSAIKAALESCTKEGDTIAISSPCFNGILELLGKMSRKIIEIPSLDDGVDLKQLETHLKNKRVGAAIFCTSHMNPQGINMSASQKQKLAELANHYRVPIIEDDVYLELSYSSHTPLPAKYYDKGGYVMWCGSVSKSLSPSYRLGWCLPGRYIDEYKAQFSAASYGVALPTQLAVADFIESGQYAKHVRRRCSQILSLRQQYLSYLTQHLPQDVKISNPQGGMVLWLQIPNLNQQAFTQAVAEQNLDIRLGHLFSTLDLYSNCLRINFGYSLEGEAKQQLDDLIKLIHQCVSG
ncbi:PLP-dependent aminotransferase family protein [Vibrio crassostreae]|uniref:aminotransferase-like domain-containing protein n=1 Tax=Vibrio crassostreae TaxID=246167 RepID=UPI000F481894|nr:PLP-dependent aminotransferase family protein [Vibrio crassostreae]NOH77061.1 PLP-dependent aminotransferase family protein [Vibrio crassostreae]NOI53354.1 PLP-dependent aminotransferase family protein [Vibrio crassostreae]ROR16089.1 GntR family transcriptional regulator [Vibrio crassostreae]CAK2086647.1 GntR family transcriptional regulator [Vibrio crassostreae]CAK2346662.1 GntR family transcriptional regulator [Vibrio crassostreae]